MLGKHRLSLALASGLCAVAAYAHHSGAMFDQAHKITLTGKVRELQWTNPHAYLQLIVLDKQGRAEEWSLEMAAPLYLQQRGWRPSIVKPGETVTVTVSPLRKMDKRKGGLLFAVFDSNGKSIGKPSPSTASAPVGRPSVKAP